MKLWGAGRAARASQTKLERRAAAAEALILAMPEAARQQALEQVTHIAQAIGGLQALPDELVEVLGKLVMDFLLEQKLGEMRDQLGGGNKPSPRALVLQIVKGAPTLLGPHRDRIEALFSG